jgi:hypothetical protein
MYANLVIIFGEGLHGTRQIRRRLALHWRSDDSGGNNQRKMVRSRHPPTAGEIALKSSQPDGVKAEVCFGQALAVARQQQANSWELRAAASMARLWRDQGKPQQARELLAPVYGWFTEGFDTLDLKEAKALLDELHA